MNDLLFGNNNQAVIRKLADRSIKSDNPLNRGAAEKASLVLPLG